MADIQEHKATVAKYVKNLNTAALDGLATVSYTHLVLIF